MDGQRLTFEVFGLLQGVLTMIDRETEEANERGDASHASYKERQRTAVAQRLKLGKATVPTKADRKPD